MSYNFNDFLDVIEYPTNEEVIAGLQEDTAFSYISTTYLNGLINYTEIIGAYMTRRYKKLKVNTNAPSSELYWEDSCKLIDNRLVGNEFHTNINMYDLDDIHILAKCGNYYYYFWRDNNCSDSSIAKISKSHYDSDNEAMKALKETITGYFIYDACESYVRDHEKDYIKYIDSRFFKGWITL